MYTWWMARAAASFAWMVSEIFNACPMQTLVVSAEDMQKSRAWQLEAEAKRQQENNAKALSIGWLRATTCC